MSTSTAPEPVIVPESEPSSPPPAARDPATVAVAAPPPPTCPETREPCLELPACELRTLGRVYCERWVKRIRAEAIAEKTKSDQP